MQYQVPEEDLAKAFESDDTLESIAIQHREIMGRFDKEKAMRAAKVIKLKEEVRAEVRKAKEHTGIAKRKRYQIKQLCKARKPPGLIELNRRIVRRKATIKKQMLKAYLGTMAGDFLRRWNETHRKGSHEDSKES